jgi:hypothetical protein
MKKLKVDIEEIAALMETHDGEYGYYLDRETGKTVSIPPELRYGGLERHDRSTLPDWEKDLVPIAEEVEAESGRYARIPQVESHEGYEDMVRFAETVTDPRMREQLAIALDGKGAFHRFKSVVHNHPKEFERWYAYKNTIMAERVREWLAEIGIEPVESTDQR